VKSLALDVERFKPDIDSEQVDARIAADQRHGKALAIDEALKGKAEVPKDRK
jgi:hypothetical protein